MIPEREPASMVFRARRAGLRATPRNSRKKASAAAGTSPPEATASRSHQATPNASDQRRKKLESENRNRSAAKSAKSVNTLERLSRRSAATERASVTIAASSAAWVRMSTQGRS
jgi:hypothetical protein